MSMLAPQARAWIRQEAMREAATDTISEATARQAVSGSGVNLGNVSIEDAVALVMFQISNDADTDLQQMLGDMQKINAQKQAMRHDVQQQRAAQAAANAQLRQEYSELRSNSPIAHSVSLDDYMNYRRISYDSLGDLSQEQQLKLNLAAERRTKAMQILSNILKKMADTDQSIIKNMK